jgi:hypothetical protein
MAIFFRVLCERWRRRRDRDATQRSSTSRGVESSPESDSIQYREPRVAARIAIDHVTALGRSESERDVCNDRDAGRFTG